MVKKNCSKIGGQAVIEGVMMRGKSTIATAVRDPSGVIQVESARFKPFTERSVWFRIPVIRGVLSFVASMVTGMKTLTRATEVYIGEDDSEPSKTEKWFAEKLKIDLISVANFVGIVLGLALSIFLFIYVPNKAADGIFSLINLDSLSKIGASIVKNLVSGIIRIAIFIGYILLTSLMKDIKRLYRYHGAEHKTISAYEHGLELTVENVQKMTTVHDRCGTTFIFIVMVVGIIFFSLFGWQEAVWQRMLIRLGGLPIVAGISYELVMLSAKYDNFLAKAFKFPGLMLQKLTTKEPDDNMVEVAITAFNTVLAMEEDESIKTQSFVTAVNLGKAKEELLTLFGTREKESEVELILMSVAGAKSKSDLKKIRLNSDILDKAKAIAKRRIAGEPLQYAIGSVSFYGYEIKTDPRALIPRFETELLAEQAVKEIAERELPKVLEICTGSGAVAVAVKMLGGEASVTASDISDEALSLAKENAASNNADITFVKSDLFASIEGKFDVIIANPPYIPTADILGLEKEVKDYEPLSALDGGMDGLDFYRRIAAEYKDCLNEKGVLLLEMGAGQSAAVSELFGGGEIIDDYNTPPVGRILLVRGE
ncbi:MAG: peptide chain release factor N(5)-glutamine methyltransferase [Clostridia bacterium]